MEKLAVVSGGNRGIGREICRQLLSHGVTVVLGSRDAAAGQRAAAALQTEMRVDAGSIVNHVLDVADTDSVNQCAAWVEKQFGRCDILVNNAGILIEPRNGALRDTPPAMFQEVLDVNVMGPVRMCQAFLPLLRQSAAGRIVNLSSTLGQLESMTAGLPAYRVSKTAVNALTCTLAAELQSAGILVNAVSPGWVKSDMGGPNADSTLQEGADTAVWLALLPDDGPTGGFFRERQKIAW